MLGALMEISVGRLFLAGVLPGTIMFIAMFALTWWLSRRRNYPREEKATIAEQGVNFREGALALLAPIVIVATIVLGIATPTEAAAVVVLYAAFLGFFVYRSLTIADVVRAAGRTAIASSVIMLTVSTSGVFAFIAVLERLGEILTRAMLAISGELVVLLLLANLLLLVLGMFMEILPILLILAPILYPLFGGMGVDPVHLSVVIVLNLMIGMITPPIGLNLFVISAIGGVGVIEIFRAAIPYVIVLFLVLMLVTYIPELTLYLPNLLMPTN
jgi:tripartite ATP-independent transporter DctM subunit